MCQCSQLARHAAETCRDISPDISFVKDGPIMLARRDVSEETISTPRLTLRRWRPEDEAVMAEINRDPEVTRYLNRPVDQAAVAAFYGICVAHWEEHGFGFYAVEDREAATDVRFIGFVGVAFPSYLPSVARRPELGWRLKRSSWGRGLATEAATAARDDAFGRLGLEELISIIHPENAASQRVATKMGMTIEGQLHNPVLDRDVDIWQVASPREFNRDQGG